jgi:hypothetical protein
MRHIDALSKHFAAKLRFYDPGIMLLDSEHRPAKSKRLACFCVQQQRRVGSRAALISAGSGA